MTFIKPTVESQLHEEERYCRTDLWGVQTCPHCWHGTHTGMRQCTVFCMIQSPMRTAGSFDLKWAFMMQGKARFLLATEVGVCTSVCFCWPFRHFVMSSVLNFPILISWNVASVVCFPSGISEQDKYSSYFLSACVWVFQRTEKEWWRVSGDLVCLFSLCHLPSLPLPLTLCFILTFDGGKKHRHLCSSLSPRPHAASDRPRLLVLTQSPFGSGLQETLWDFDA